VTAESEYVSQFERAHALLDSIQSALDDSPEPEGVDYSDVSEMGRLVSELSAIADRLYRRGDYAR
jgi:hypothetical protein